MLSGVFTVSHMKTEGGVPSGVKRRQKGQGEKKRKRSPISLLSILPPCLPSPALPSLFVPPLSCIHIAFSSPSWQLTMLSLCVSPRADNPRSDLSWTALESGGSCLLLYWGTCLLCCKDEGPRILDIPPTTPLPLSLLLLHPPSHLDTATVCSDFFFLPSPYSHCEWQHTAWTFYKNACVRHRLPVLNRLAWSL